jgi:magnesium transporter
LLENGDLKNIKLDFLHLDFHDVADYINAVKKKASKITLFLILSEEIQSQVIIRLSEHSKKIIIPELSIIVIARFLQFNDDDDATDILQYLPQEKQNKILQKIKESKRLKLQKLLQFGNDTAGGLMDLNYVIVKDSFSFTDIVEKVQSHIEKEHNVPFVIMTTGEGHVKGYIPHKNLLFGSPNTPPKMLVRSLITVKYSTKHNGLLKIIKKSPQDIIGVIDEKNLMVGIIHIKDLLNFIQAESTKSVFSFAGVNKEESLEDSVLTKVSMRYKWLIINLATAFLASFVVSLFEDTISKLALLAVFMPVVAGEGGNAATQSLAVVVRGLTTGNIDWITAKSIIFKEAVAGFLNGLIVGFFATLVAIFINAPPLLGVILGLSMILNLCLAGFFGALTPLILKRLNIDPAVSSSVFVTTVTDIVGFFVFLGLGTILLL